MPVEVPVVSIFPKKGISQSGKNKLECLAVGCEYIEIIFDLKKHSEQTLRQCARRCDEMLIFLLKKTIRSKSQHCSIPSYTTQLLLPSPPAPYLLPLKTSPTCVRGGNPGKNRKSVPHLFPMLCRTVAKTKLFPGKYYRSQIKRL